VAFIGAVSIGSMVFDALYWVFGFLRMGTAAIVAQAYGAGDDARAGQTLLQSATLALLLGVSIILLREPIATLGLRLAGGTPEVQRWAHSYIEIRILGAPAVLLVFALSGFFRGMKDAVTPLVVTLVIHIVNVVGDVLLIYGLLGLPKLGVVGAAWASLFGALAGVSVALAVLGLRYNQALRAGWHAVGLFSPRRLRRLLATQTHLFNRTLLLMAAYFVMVAVAARLGEVPLAANAILLQLWYLSAYSIDGVALACETLVGNALGAGEAALTRRLIGRATLWGFAISGVYALLYLVGMRLIAGAFTRDPQVVRTVVGLTWIMVLLQPINAIAFVFDGVFIGANDTRFLSVQIAVSCLGVFIPAVLLLAGVLGLGLAGLWIAMALFSMARATILAARCRQPSWIDGRLREATLV
jgi:MATE family multidrug resistance protein